jgi:putative ABC transport system ATP-binding protein
MTTLVELTEVSKRYDSGSDRPALDAVSLRVAARDFTAVMGPSGSGKSTLLNLIAGLDRPTGGSIVVDGIDLGLLREAELARYRRGRIGFVFQFFNLLNNLTVLDNVLLPSQLVGTSPREAEARALELLDQLDIADKARAFPGRLSGGQQQRVAIARAMINRPLLLMADEPTGALDSQGGEQVLDLLKGLNESGQTVILVTHNARLAARYARRVVGLRDGRVVDAGDAAQSDGRRAAEPVGAGAGEPAA